MGVFDIIRFKDFELLNKIFTSQKRGGTYEDFLLYSDEFTETVAAPIPAGNADVRGYRVVNDVESLMTIGSGVLAVPAQATAAWGDEYYRAQPSSGQQYWERPSGKALVAVVDFRHSTRATHQVTGWWSNPTLDNSANQLSSISTASNFLAARVGSGGVSDSQAYLADTDYPSVAVWDSTGFHTYVKISDIWHKKWFAPSSATQAYCGMSNLSSAGSLKYFRIYAVDENLFAPALSISAPSIGNLPDMPDGDFLLYLDNITLPSVGDTFLFTRKKDASNYWRNRFRATAAYQVTEFVAGVGTDRVNVAGLVNADDITTIARAQNIQAWRNTTALGSAYTSAYNFLREVGLELNSLGTGGAIGALYAWKARLLDELGLGAELVVNGDFASDTVWTKGTGWTISGGSANRVPSAGSENLTQNILTVGKYYELTFTVSNYVAGSVTPLIGVSGNLVSVTANGTYTYRGVCAGNTTLYFQGNPASNLSIDNVSCKEITFTADSLALVLDGLAA